MCKYMKFLMSVDVVIKKCILLRNFCLIYAPMGVNVLNFSEFVLFKGPLMHYLYFVMKMHYLESLSLMNRL